MSKDQPHDKQLEQRIQNTPQHTQRGPCVFLFEIPLYQLFKEKLVLFQFIKHR